MIDDPAHLHPPVEQSSHQLKAAVLLLLLLQPILRRAHRRLINVYVLFGFSKRPQHKGGQPKNTTRRPDVAQ